MSQTGAQDTIDLKAIFTKIFRKAVQLLVH